MVQSEQSTTVRVSLETLVKNLKKIQGEGTAGISASAQLQHLYLIGIAIVERLENLERALS